MQTLDKQDVLNEKEEEILRLIDLCPQWKQAGGVLDSVLLTESKKGSDLVFLSTFLKKETKMFEQKDWFQSNRKPYNSRWPYLTERAFRPIPFEEYLTYPFW